jgi:FkbM family methyltransferase
VHARLTNEDSDVATIRIPSVRSSINLRRRTTDVGTFEQVFFTDQYGSHLYSDLRPRFIVDCGANIGLSTLWFANRYPDATIVAVEPDPSNFALLRENVRSYSNIKPCAAAVWSASVPLRIANPDAAKDAYRVERTSAKNGTTVDGMTMTDILDSFGLDTIDLLKLDIEGVESELFADGAPDWLDRVKVLVIELHEWLIPGSSHSFERAIEGRPMRRFRVGEHDILVL